MNAFLNGVLNETVFIHQPPGFKNKKYPTHVSKFHKDLYGLKQGARACYNRFSNFLLSQEFCLKHCLTPPYSLSIMEIKFLFFFCMWMTCWSWVV